MLASHPFLVEFDFSWILEFQLPYNLSSLIDFYVFVLYWDFSVKMEKIFTAFYILSGSETSKT